MIRPLFSVIPAALYLAGCSVVTPAGLSEAMRLDPLQTDPGDISVAVSVPDAVQLHDGDATLYLGFQPDDASLAPLETTVPLGINRTGDLPRAPLAGEGIYVFDIAPEDAETVSSIQKQIRDAKTAGTEGLGTLSVNVNGGCLTAEPDNGFFVSTWLRAAPSGEFVPLTRETDLLAATGDDPSEIWPAC